MVTIPPSSPVTSMQCYCLVAQSTPWSSCDRINLSDLILQPWDREIRKKLEKFPKNKESRRENNCQMFCCSSEALKTPFLSMVCFDTQTLDIQKRRFATALSNESNWTRYQRATPPVASKATRPQRIKLTWCSRSISDSKKCLHYFHS